MKKKYLDSKIAYQNRLIKTKRKPKHVSMNDWNYLANIWSDITFQVCTIKVITLFAIVIVVYFFY